MRFVADGCRLCRLRSNGDDTVGLVRTDPSSGRQTLVDLIGGLGDDPGDGWAVAGIEVSAQQHCLRLLRLCFTHHPLLCGVVSAGLARLK